MNDITTIDPWLMHIPSRWPRDWPIRRGDSWFCPDCRASADLRVEVFPGKACIRCGFESPAWAVPFKTAFRIALKQASEGRYDLVDNCFHCGDPLCVKALAVCLNCNRETSYTHEVDVLKYFVDPGADLSKVQLHPELLERL